MSERLDWLALIRKPQGRAGGVRVGRKMSGSERASARPCNSGITHNMGCGEADGLPLCPHRIIEEILVRKAQALLKLGGVRPSEGTALRDIEELAGSAVGAAGVPENLALVTDNLGDKFGQILDCNSLPVPALTVSLPE